MAETERYVRTTTSLEADVPRMADRGPALLAARHCSLQPRFIGCSLLHLHQRRGPFVKTSAAGWTWPSALTCRSMRCTLHGSATGASTVFVYVITCGAALGLGERLSHLARALERQSLQRRNGAE